jgi:hypothetical protein
MGRKQKREQDSQKELVREEKRKEARLSVLIAFWAGGYHDSDPLWEPEAWEKRLFEKESELNAPSKAAQGRGGVEGGESLSGLSGECNEGKGESGAEEKTRESKEEKKEAEEVEAEDVEVKEEKGEILLSAYVSLGCMVTCLKIYP